MVSKRFQNTAWRSYWSTHIEAWRRSGLSRTKYCRDHRLNKATFDRWLKQLEGAEAAKKAAELLREQRRQRRRRGPSPLCKSKRSIAVQAFWAMHVEALNWSGLAGSTAERGRALTSVSARTVGCVSAQPAEPCSGSLIYLLGLDF
ncbi:hypothetical protein IYW40_05515 [Methylocystis sp. H4A]|uniref:IS66 family insertion sequence element accessory protein TnpA n=1 Tax=Methylocystis sp. H4A TaxID=2785788 RepID=UPI0018C23291|nr:hypothetical protein [Methylocystis sp. H4A]MBG0800949.1 hypothetical protein [Methylocystis sp. H4A]